MPASDAIKLLTGYFRAKSERFLKPAKAGTASVSLPTEDEVDKALDASAESEAWLKVAARAAGGTQSGQIRLRGAIAIMAAARRDLAAVRSDPASRFRRGAAYDEWIASGVERAGHIGIEEGK